MKFRLNIGQLNFGVTIALSVLTIAFWIPSFISSDQIMNVVGCFCLCVVNSVLLMWVSYKAAVIRLRSALPIFLYLLFNGSIQTIHSDWEAQFVITALLLCCYLLINVYRKNNSAEDSFLIGMFLTLSALIQPLAIVAIPLAWLGLYFQRAFNFKAILATLLGVAVVAVYACLLWHFNFLKLPWLEQPFNISFSLNILSVGLAALGVFYAICGMRLFANSNVGGQSFFVFAVAVFLIFSIGCFFKMNTIKTCLPIVLSSIAAMSTFYYSSRQSQFASVCFILQILIAILVYTLLLFL